MWPGFVESSVEAYDHVYSLDLSLLQRPFWQSLIAAGAAVVVLALIIRSFTWRSLGLSIFWGALCTFWGALGLLHDGGWLGGMGREGHVLTMFREQIHPLECSLLAAAGLGFWALVALYFTRPVGLRFPPWRVPLGLSLFGVMGWAVSAGIHALQAVALIGHVPVLEAGEQHPVQVGYPFQFLPTGGRWAGLYSNQPSFDCDDGFFLRRLPRRFMVRDLDDWKFPQEPSVAQHAGDNALTFAMTHRGAIRFVAKTRFHVMAEPETGNPLWSLREGDRFTYRWVSEARSKQVLLRQFAKGELVSSKRDGVVVTPESFTIHVERSKIKDGVRIFEIQLGEGKRYLASMWSGETYVMTDEHQLFERKTWVPLLNTFHAVPARSKELFPCGVGILPYDGECLCNTAPIDAKRPLLGLAYCIEQHRTTHDGQNALSAIFGVLTLGATGFHMRGPETRYQGLFLESSSP